MSAQVQVNSRISMDEHCVERETIVRDMEAIESME